MPFHFTCPYCFKKTLVSDDMAGQTGPCSGCAKQVTIPGEVPASPQKFNPVDDQYVDQASLQNRKFLIWCLKSLAVVVATLSALGMLGFILWPMFGRLQRQRNVIACTTNMQRIVKALNEYAVDYGTYPPAAIYNKAGKPMHSWRVLLLPYLGEESLYAKYNFEEPWDSTNNADLIDRCPLVYISPSVSMALPSESNYVLITGAGTLFPRSGPLGPKDIADGTDQTLLVVETHNIIDEWTKPIDIDFGLMARRIGVKGNNVIGGNHEGGAAGAFADGSGAWIRDDITPELLDGLVTPNGGEPVNPENFRYGK
ncbi:MAG: DUF1559 domain-containing protein [Planctomycetota bacterium]